MVLAINIFMTMLSASYWSMTTVAVCQILLQILLHIFRLHWDRFGILLYWVVAMCFIIVHSLQGILSILLVVASSWLVIGRRQPGEYDWDQSNYCQMWNLHITLSQTINDGSGDAGVLTSLAGTAYIVWYLRALGAKIGMNCAIWAGGQVGLMSEPDLLEVRHACNKAIL
jgi:ABC-type phosphate transport system permease subunit